MLATLPRSCRLAPLVPVSRPRGNRYGSAPAFTARQPRLGGTFVRQIIAALLGITLLAAAGCSPETVEQTAVSPAVPPTTVAPPSTAARPQALSRAQAAKRYLAIVKPYNVALERLEQAFNAGRPLDALRALSRAVATANDTQMDELRATLWPTALRQPMRRLVAESAVAQRYWLQATTAGTRAPTRPTRSAAPSGSAPTTKETTPPELDDS